jgi:hypothetical protein
VATAPCEARMSATFSISQITEHEGTVSDVNAACAAIRK